ncbi:MAG: hypothetical protein D6714_00655 [Bacteroidetes bacterium]|nr:MAG: hypothetical protein D6714_00655 [Bacteroidota bacterium]
MKLQALQTAFQAYKHYLRKQAGNRPHRRPPAGLYKWESLKIFQENWDLDAPDLAEMYDRSLQNAETRRLWKRENFEPKDMMLKFIRLQPDFVRYMFTDLFNEEKDIVGRVDRFVFHCDELLREYKEQNPRSVENNHFHNDDYQMVSLYLAFRYPDQYTLYDFDHFRALLTFLEAPNVPKTGDFGRFCKVMRTIYKLMSKDEALMDLHRARLDPARHYSGETLLIVEDFYRFLVARPGAPGRH